VVLGATTTEVAMRAMAMAEVVTWTPWEAWEVVAELTHSQISHQEVAEVVSDSLWDNEKPLP
jgi:hypothetical protein